MNLNIREWYIGSFGNGELAQSCLTDFVSVIIVFRWLKEIVLLKAGLAYKRTRSVLVSSVRHGFLNLRLLVRGAIQSVVVRVNLLTVSLISGEAPLLTESG